MNAHNDHGVRPPSHKRLLRALRKNVVATLGVNDPSEILDHSVAQACHELEALSALLRDTQFSLDAGAANAYGFALKGIADRLQLARDLDGGLFDPDHPENTVLFNGQGEEDDK